MVSNATQPRRLRMVVSDLDGTLRSRAGETAAEDLAALERLGQLGIPRVLATGRSWFSLVRAGADRLPLDYAVVSSGAGVVRLQDAEVIRAERLTPAEVGRAAAVLSAMDLDFMIHEPIPDNHRFVYHSTGRQNPDFWRRVELYDEHCARLDGEPSAFGESTQLVAIAPSSDGTGSALHASVRDELGDLVVIRATSPLDHESTWLEILPAGASKGRAVSWLSRQLGVARRDVMAIGNDFNDADLLDWAGSSFVVDDSPAELRARHTVLAPDGPGAVAEAIDRWLGGSRPS